TRPKRDCSSDVCSSDLRRLIALPKTSNLNPASTRIAFAGIGRRKTTVDTVGGLDKIGVVSHIKIGRWQIGMDSPHYGCPQGQCGIPGNTIQIIALIIPKPSGPNIVWGEAAKPYISLGCRSTGFACGFNPADRSARACTGICDLFETV